MFGRGFQCLIRASGRVLRAKRSVALGTHGNRSVHSLTKTPSNALRSRNLRQNPDYSARHSSTSVVVPAMGDSISEGTIAALLKSPGDYVEADEVVVQIETDKVTIDVPAPGSGQITSFACGEDDTVEVGVELFQMEVGEIPADANKSSEPTPEPASATEKTAPAPPPTPTPQPAPAQVAPTPTPEPGSRSSYSVPLSRMQLRSQQHLKDTQSTAATLTTFNEINMHNLMSLRVKYKDAFEKKHGVELGFMSAFVKAASTALLQEASVNSSIVGSEQVLYDYTDIGIATATSNGLVVPVLRNTEQLSFADTERAIADLGSKARTGSLAIEDMAGGTFTIANGGVFGALMSQPMLKAPQSAVLGLHGVTQRPVFIDNQVKLQPMMYVALTYDHRIIDGREAVTFLKHVKELIEDPRRMVLGL